MTTFGPTSVSYSQLAIKVSLESEIISSELFGDSLVLLNGIVQWNAAFTSLGQFPQQVKDAELSLLRALDIQNLHVYADANFAAAGSLVNNRNITVGETAYISLPNDCEIVRYLVYFIPENINPSQDNFTDQYSGTAVSLLQIDEQMLQIYWPNKSVTSPPIKYAILGSAQNQTDPAGQILVAPTPDKPYAIRLGYITRPNSLTEQNLTTGATYISTWYPDLLFVGCMVRANEFMKNPTMAQLWNQHFQSALQNAKAIETRKKSQSYADTGQSTPPLPQRSQ